MKMKAIKLFSMAVAALMMAACSSNDDVIQQQTAQPQGKKMHFTATIEAPNSGATTRTTYTEDGTTINVAWKEGDQIALIHGGVKDVVTVGTPNGDGSAPISGDITVGTDGEDVVLAYPAAAVYSATPHGTFPFTPNPTCWDKAHAQDGTLEFIQNNIDFRMGSGKLSVSGDPATASLKESVKMPSMISIWKLTLQDNTSAALSATAVTVKANGELVAGATSTAKSAYYLCMVPSFIPAGDLVIEATDGSDTYTYTKAGGVSLTVGKFYQSTVTLTKAAPAATDLSTINANYTASDGETLTGTLGANVKISIADGATVTLDNVTINGVNDLNYEWAGITCLGDATIILSGTNTVKGFYEDYPGIQAAAGKTLIINGTGSLTASSYGYAAAIGGGNGVACGNIEIQGGTITATSGGLGAGIGGGYNASCGNITISGGTVSATGGEYGAGIGGGYNASWGNITISGGNVTATGGQSGAGIGGGKRGPASFSCGNIIISGGTVTATGGNNAAGIGGGRGNNSSNFSSCGDITITTGVTEVTATKGDGATNSIGAGYYGTCGTVTIGGNVGAITTSPYTYQP